METTTVEHTSDDVRTPNIPRKIGVRLSTAILGLILAVFVVATGIFAALYLSAKGDLADRETQSDDNSHAEQIASDYAVGASTINYQDLNSWLERLKVGTTPELANKFDATAPQLEQILLPLQWTATAAPVAAVVTSESGGIFQVSAFVNVSSTNAQTPEGSQVTVTYSVAIDSNADWKITEVGGMSEALAVK